MNLLSCEVTWYSAPYPWLLLASITIFCCRLQCSVGNQVKRRFQEKSLNKQRYCCRSSKQPLIVTLDSTSVASAARMGYLWSDIIISLVLTFANYLSVRIRTFWIIPRERRQLENTESGNATPFSVFCFNDQVVRRVGCSLCSSEQPSLSCWVLTKRPRTNQLVV